MDKAYWGTMRWGYFRWGVYNDLFERLMSQFKNLASHNITLRKLSLGARDSTTGWRAKTYTESTIEGLFATKASAPTALPPGTYVRTDAWLAVMDGVSSGDEILTAQGNYYEVKAVRDHPMGDDFYFRECDLTHLPMHT